jgi:hypothetical protein
VFVDIYKVIVENNNNIHPKQDKIDPPIKEFCGGGEGVFSLLLVELADDIEVAIAEIAQPIKQTPSKPVRNEINAYLILSYVTAPLYKLFIYILNKKYLILCVIIKKYRSEPIF